MVLCSASHVGIPEAMAFGFPKNQLKRCLKMTWSDFHHQCFSSIIAIMIIMFIIITTAATTIIVIITTITTTMNCLSLWLSLLRVQPNWLKTQNWDQKGDLFRDLYRTIGIFFGYIPPVSLGPTLQKPTSNPRCSSSGRRRCHSELRCPPTQRATPASSKPAGMQSLVDSQTEIDVFDAENGEKKEQQTWGESYWDLKLDQKPLLTLLWMPWYIW